MSEDTYIECKVHDTGCGIKPEDIKNLFSVFNEDEPTSAAPQSSISVTKGVGLGLSTTKLLTEAQSGKADVKSVLKEFTTITFTTRVEEQQNILVDQKPTKIINPRLYVIPSVKAGQAKENKLKDLFGGKVKEDS